ncbi:MAG: 3-deoxy-manno-octulosonate cytidylyltransferase [Gemmatimonadetes bacterium]|nr:3-deoxy-manno-octulosonate cytidylyltransferase [Gemmatimonadota bacterium]
MRAARVLGVIPARLGSERLPRKPLYPIAGRPLIEWVWRRVRDFSGLDQLVIATDSEEVAEICHGFGAAVELTAATHRSGTERVAEVAARPAYGGYDVVLNIQGDEPFVGEEQVGAATRLVTAGWEVGTVATPVRDLGEWRDPGVVKVVCGDDGRALYFSRAPIPFRRDGEPGPEELATGEFLRHIGVYAYSPEALARWVALPAHELERTERLEQLRALAGGLRIGVAVVATSEPGVDTPADARRAEAQLQEMKAPFIPIGT